MSNNSVKARILKTLEENRGFPLSTYDLLGEVDASHLHVVRARISELKREGYPIKSFVANDGIGNVAFHKLEEAPL